jgi:hypothetical protein
VLAASLAASPLAATDGSADTELIRLCGRLDALQTDFAELFSRRDTIEQENATDHELTALQTREDALMAQFESAGMPTTMAGIVAVARVGLAMHPHRDADGTTIAFDDSHWLLLMACEALTAST